MVFLFFNTYIKQFNPDYALGFVMKVENTITRACKSEQAQQIFCSRTFFDEVNEVQ